MKMRPFLLYGLWDEGWALDTHTISSISIGDDPFGHPRFETIRTELGECLYQLKYCGRTENADMIAKTAVEFLKEQPWFGSVDIVLPAPPSKPRDFQPTFLISQAIANACGKFYSDDVLVKSNSQESKNLSRDEKVQLDNSVVFVQKLIRPCSILVVDDICSSGTTLTACVNALRRDPNTCKVYVLAITQTRKR